MRAILSYAVVVIAGLGLCSGTYSQTQIDGATVAFQLGDCRVLLNGVDVGCPNGAVHGQFKNGRHLVSFPANDIATVGFAGPRIELTVNDVGILWVDGAYLNQQRFDADGQCTFERMQAGAIRLECKAVLRDGRKLSASLRSPDQKETFLGVKSSVAATPSARPVIGPSFDCGGKAAATQPLAQIICNSSELAYWELSYVIAYQALREAASPEERKLMASEANSLVLIVNERCNIQKAGTLQRFPTAQEVSCVKGRFQEMRRALIDRATGAAREEAILEPAETIAIQKALQAKSYLPPSAEIDGVLGPTTRKAIASWQRDGGIRESGFGSKWLLTLLRSDLKLVPPPPKPPTPTRPDTIQQEVAEQLRTSNANVEKIVRLLEEADEAAKRKDYATALRIWKPLADRGSAEAQTNVGILYEHGHGVLQDDREAIRFYRLAAEQGYPGAQSNLGFIYLNAKGVSQDNVRAYMWFNLAASAKDVFLPETTRRNRDDVAKMMTPEQISQAQRMSQKCQQSNFKDCGEGQSIAVAVPSGVGASRGAQISMKKEGGTYVVPVLINNAITLDFMVDSGASDVSIPEDVVTTLMRTGTIRATDFIGEKTYVLADGSRVQSKTFLIRSLKVGDWMLENVTGSVASKSGSLLLGQSFLGRFKSWSIDNTKHALVLE